MRSIKSQFQSLHKKEKEHIKYIEDDKDKYKDTKQQNEEDEEELKQEQQRKQQEQKQKETQAISKSQKKKKKKLKTTLQFEEQIVKSIDQNALLRRWDVKFIDIKVQSLIKEPMNIFIIFKIGVKSNNRQKDPDIVIEKNSYKEFYTEVVKNLQRDETRYLDKCKETEIHASYNMLKTTYLEIEVWEYNRWSLNCFLGKCRTLLEDIAKGHIIRSFVVRRSFKDKRQFVRIILSAYFQEIWDFRIDFEDLQGTNTIDKQNQPISSYLKLTLMDDKKSSLKTKPTPNKTKNPTWGNSEDFAHFRGTLDDLTDLIVIDSSQSQMCSLITLRGIDQYNNINAVIKLKVDKNKINSLKKSQKDQNQEQNNNEEDEKIYDQEDIYATVDGRINLNEIPRYIQQGELVRYSSEQLHLCIIVNRVNNIMAPDDRGVINSYVQVQCSNEIKRTRTLCNNFNPDFGEEMIFKIPLLNNKSLFSQSNKSKDKEYEYKLEALRDELQKRSEIKFQLWVEGDSITYGDNLGQVSFNLSEIGSTQTQIEVQDKSVMDFLKKQIKTYKIKSANFTKNFTSSRFDASRINITFSVFFLPQLPEKIDLRDLQAQNYDQYPYELKDLMKIPHNDYTKNVLYKQWDSDIKKAFQNWNLQKNEWTIFKNVFVKDHYGRIHFISKFIERFQLSKSKDPDMQKDLEIQDYYLETLQDLAHYVRCIPYTDIYSNDVWFSSDFFLSLKRGSIIDHALLMAVYKCTIFFIIIKSIYLFLIKDLLDYESEQVPLDDRVFVCIGTNQNLSITAWVMVFNQRCDSVTFYDAKENQKFILNGRVKPDQVQSLKKHLYPDLKIKGQSKMFFFKQNNNNNEEKKQKKEEEIKKQQIIEQKLKEKEQEIQKEINIEIEQQNKLKSILEEENKQDYDKNQKTQIQKNLELVKNANLDDIVRTEIIFSSDVINNNGKPRNLLKPLTRYTLQSNQNVLNANNGENAKLLSVNKNIQSETNNNQLNTKELNKSVVQITQIQQDQIIDRKTLKQKQLDNRNPQSFLNQHRIEQNEQMNQDQKAIFKKAEIFIDPVTKEQIQEEEKLPYKAIQIIFNQKNVYGNINNQNPSQIYYHLHDKTQWNPFIKDFNQKIGSFFISANPFPRMKQTESQEKYEKIIKEIKYGIAKIRNNQGLTVKWKNQYDKTNTLLRKLSRILEYKERDKKFEEKSFEQNMEDFEKDMKRLMPLNYHFQCLPMKFLYLEKSQIRSLIEEKASQFILLKKKNMIFGVSGKIFCYQNGINPVRIILAIYYNKAEGVFDNEEQNNLSNIQEDQDEEDLDDDQEDDNLYQKNQNL
ncbi:hypothetical protein IMG5_134820 [Ichthyophthirius multifiliis]|uniref:C2 domain-containing protein n=1 Tax=Ichthyophthirius multifiliis TaxID=5932 RepID=G0QWS8_ICHMU|nr:hypothetical protein IMG5_134820 [Ichthyophthirius multifiliis]EGR30333.1 hypothetical protein IMG5_134820 [Ichthyophthirius multifiliis]|eukprot:XP_004031920.1 hypothetical protein IMG5_134820 [Ichthyophthirius multifiliis]